MEKTEAKSEQIISAANANAQKTVDSANKLAEETVAKAKSDAAAIVEKAQQTANKLLDENEITAQARAYASQLKVNSQNEATERVNSAIARAEEMPVSYTHLDVYKRHRLYMVRQDYSISVGCCQTAR